jgi:arabinose-5-phosphate isomerase
MVGTVCCAVQRRVQTASLRSADGLRPQRIASRGVVGSFAPFAHTPRCDRGPVALKYLARLSLVTRFVIESNLASPHPRRVTHLAKAREVFDIEIAALRKVRTLLDQSFNNAVELVAQTLSRRGKIVIVGIGKSGNVGAKIAATLTSTGSTSVVLNSVDALHGDLGIVNDGDVILALSYSGESEELLNLLPALKRFSIKIISLTGGLKSSLAKHSDIVLNVHVPKEACPFNLAPTSSTTAMLVLGDALAMAVLQARGFKQSDFARYHPSGAIGRALLLRVGEIMRTGERNAVGKEALSVRDALLVMTKAKSGSISVVNARGKLAGVFTDGDFRRKMSDDENLLARPLSSVMTRNPICVQETALAAEALKSFNERNIDDLIVVNAKHEPVGLIDLQDLPKLKIM